MSKINDIIEHLTEGDDFSVKDATQEPMPEFQFRVANFKLPSTLHVFVADKWIGVVGKVSWQEIGGKRFLLPTTEKNPYVPELWTANALPNMEEHPAQETFKSANEAAQWLWDHRQYASTWKLESLDDEGSLGKEMSVPAVMPIGTRVKPTRGTYTNQLGTVIGRTPYGKEGEDYGVLVHFDSYDDDDIARAFQPKELEIVPYAPNPPKLRVQINNGQFAGSFGWITGQDRSQGILSVHPDDAEDLWQSVPVSHADVRFIDEALRIVNEVIDDDSEPNPFIPGPAIRAANNLREAGFNVTKTEEGLIECNWQSPTLKTFTLGAQRARQIIGEHLKGSVVSVQRKGNLTEMFIRNRT